MGYTHYWYREKEYSSEEFKSIVDDFKKVVPELEKVGVKLAGGLGKDDPRITDEDVWFNGLENCGHEEFNLHIAWPSKNAGGVGKKPKEAVNGTWFAGAQIETRVCGGDCSHETFHFPRILELSDWQKKQGIEDLGEDGLLFAFCKSAYKPYDLAVNCFLIIAKYRLSKRIMVHSDGENEHWFDGMLLCHKILGYGLEFKLDRSE